jgi:hypothetical protein
MSHDVEMVTNILKKLTAFIFCPEDGVSMFLSEILVNTFNSMQNHNAEDHNPYFS